MKFNPENSGSAPDLLGSLLDGSSLERATGPQGLMCSRKGCQDSAQWQLKWNNPKIHDESRRKVWLACTDHREFLSDFLTARGFLRSIEDVPSSATGQETWLD